MTRASWLTAGLIVSIRVLSVSTPAAADEPARLAKGIHLLIDDHWIAKSEGVERKVQQPRRSLSEPIVTGALEHQNWQPFLTVIRDSARPANPFRMWYNVDTVDDPADGNYFGATGLLESADGMKWKGPYERLISLTVDGRVRFGANVIDDGPRHPISAERYKILYFDAGEQVGPRVAFSPDGVKWTLHNGGKPILQVNNGDDIWSAAWDPIRGRYFLLGKTYGSHTWTNAEGKKVTATIRRYFQCVSRDFKLWSEPKMIFSPDERDSGITQWYGPAGFLVRGDLIVAFLRELRDDLSPAGVPAEAVEANTGGKAGLGGAGKGMGSGFGYTVLAWTRDGNSWHRDRFTDKFFEPDPKPGTWDHAMSWIGSAVPVDDEVYLYYAGYRWGHKYHHSIDRQIGLVRMKRDRFVAREAGEKPGTLTTRPFLLDADALALHLEAAGGEVRAQLTDPAGEPIAGYRFADCRPISVDSLTAPLEWKESVERLHGRQVKLEISLKKAKLFAIEAK